MPRNPVLSAALLFAAALGLGACDDGDSLTTPAPARAPAGGADGEVPGTMEWSGEITGDTTWEAATIHILRGAVFVESGATLTIEPGTLVVGDSATNGTLVVSRGGRLMAAGTPEAPIVMTSDQVEGERARGDWGGLIINGYAPLNIPGGLGEGEGDTGAYGGMDPMDDSGVLRYVRVEFAGAEFSPDNELNGIAFQGVGNGTVVDYVQVHFNKDDGVEFFGGTVDAKHVICTGIADDSYDWTEGWTGRGQFWIAQQRGDDADQGIEADSNAENNDLEPFSNPTLYNLTLIGDPDTNEGDESDVGMLLREGTRATIVNAVVIGFKDEGVRLDHAKTYEHAAAGDLAISHSLFHGNLGGAFGDGGNRPDTAMSANELLMSPTVFSGIDPMLADPYNHEALNCNPLPGSPLTLGAATPPADGFFDPVTYVGACAPDDDWYMGWTTFAQK